MVTLATPSFYIIHDVFPVFSTCINFLYLLVCDLIEDTPMTNQEVPVQYALHALTNKGCVCVCVCVALCAMAIVDVTPQDHFESS